MYLESEQSLSFLLRHSRSKSTLEEQSTTPVRYKGGSLSQENRDQESPKGDFNWAVEGRFFSEGRGWLNTVKPPHNLVADYCVT